MIEHDAESKCYIGCTVEMPSSFGEGATIEACAKDTLKAAIAGICTLLEIGERPPSPARAGLRDKQLNIRISGNEKLALEAAAEREGFRSVADFVRAVALKAS